MPCGFRDAAAVGQVLAEYCDGLADQLDIPDERWVSASHPLRLPQRVASTALRRRLGRQRHAHGRLWRWSPSLVRAAFCRLHAQRHAPSPRGADDRTTKGTANRNKGTDNRTKGTANRNKGTDDRTKGTDNSTKVTANRN